MAVDLFYLAESFNKVIIATNLNNGGIPNERGSLQNALLKTPLGNIQQWSFVFFATFFL
jgi:hypothetical protein